MQAYGEQVQLQDPKMTFYSMAGLNGRMLNNRGKTLHHVNLQYKGKNDNSVQSCS